MDNNKSNPAKSRGLQDKTSNSTVDCNNAVDSVESGKSKSSSKSK